jgi:hypothetical protein
MHQVTVAVDDIALCTEDWGLPIDAAAGRKSRVLNASPNCLKTDWIKSVACI